MDNLTNRRAIIGCAEISLVLSGLADPTGDRRKRKYFPTQGSGLFISLGNSPATLCWHSLGVFICHDIHRFRNAPYISISPATPASGRPFPVYPCTAGPVLPLLLEKRGGYRTLSTSGSDPSRSQ